MFYVLYTRRFRPDAAFAYVIRVVRIVTALICRIRKFCTVLICVVCWRRIGAAFIYGVRRFSFAVSECAWNVLKIWWGTDVENFGARKAHVRCQKLGLVTSVWGNMQFNVLQYDFSVCWMRQKVGFNWQNINVPAYSEICMCVGCESFVPFDAAFSATCDGDENLMCVV